MADLLGNLVHEFGYHKDQADRALAQLDDEAFFRKPADHSNPVGVIVKHLAGNLASRWTDFLTSDGEKPTRDRDAEFVLTPQDTRGSLLAAWERGWQTLFSTLHSLGEADLGRTILIRGEEHTVLQALLRGLTHAAYHTGQILYLVRLWRPEGTWLTVAPGQSCMHRGSYLRPR